MLIAQHGLGICGPSFSPLLYLNVSNEAGKRKRGWDLENLRGDGQEDVGAEIECAKQI